MQQTGSFYTAVNNENSTETKRALANIFIYFSQNGARKLTTKTDAAGKFSFDLPIGDYQVTISQGANFSVHSLAGGATFSLTSASKVDDFEKWVMTPITIKPEDNPLIVRLAELAKIANDAATEAKAIADQMDNNSIGSGKWMKEGAYGIGSNSSQRISGNDFDSKSATGFYAVDHTTLSQEKPREWGILLRTAYGNNNDRMYDLFIDVNGFIYTRNTQQGREWSAAYNTKNTIVDSNGFIKAASPIIRLFNDRIETNDQFLEEPIFKKLAPGTYKISNTLGLAQEGWTYEKPRGSDGQPYFRIVVDKLDDGCIVTVHDEYDDYESVEITDIDGNKRIVTKQTKVLSVPRDIKEHERWIDLRFHEEEQELEDEELLPQLDNLDESAH